MTLPTGSARIYTSTGDRRVRNQDDVCSFTRSCTSFRFNCGLCCSFVTSHILLEYHGPLKDPFEVRTTIITRYLDQNIQVPHRQCQLSAIVRSRRKARCTEVLLQPLASRRSIPWGTLGPALTNEAGCGVPSDASPLFLYERKVESRSNTLGRSHRCTFFYICAIKPNRVPQQGYQLRGRAFTQPCSKHSVCPRAVRNVTSGDP